MLVTICLNTLIMAINGDCDYCQAGCATRKGVLEASNLFFTAVFTLESLIKIIGFGPWRWAWKTETQKWKDERGREID